MLVQYAEKPRFTNNGVQYCSGCFSKRPNYRERNYRERELISEVRVGRTTYYKLKRLQRERRQKIVQALDVVLDTMGAVADLEFGTSGKINSCL